MKSPLIWIPRLALLGVTGLLSACVGGSGSGGLGAVAPATPNTLTLTIDGGPAAAGGMAYNHAYVTVRVCAPGSTSQCANIDHVLLDTGSWGLRLVGSVLSSHSVTLAAETDAQGHAIQECVFFGGGQTWGPVAQADVTLAGEVAAKLPVQIMDDAAASAPPPAGCGDNGSLINGVGGFMANGVLGVGVFAQDCGSACVNAATPLPVYYGCTAGAAGVCTAVNLPLAQQVTNPVAAFAKDNNGVIIDLPALANANGETTASGTLTLGIATQADNTLPAAPLTVLGANSSGDFTATYNGGTTVLPSLIDSGTDAIYVNDPAIPVCASGNFVGYYCPTVAPLPVFAVNTGVGKYTTTSTINFAVADPNTFLSTGTAFGGLGAGAGASRLVWGLPFFFGRKVYVGIDQRTVGSYVGPFYAY